MKILEVIRNRKQGQTMQWPNEQEQTMQWPNEQGQTIQWPNEQGQTIQWPNEQDNTNNNVQNTTRKTKDRATRTSL